MTINKHYMSRLFGRSPIRPLQKHMEQVLACVDLLPEVVTNCIDGDIAAARKIYEEMSAFESVADELKREVRLNLPGTLFMPVARADLLDMLNAQDKMANRAQDIAGLMVGRRMTIPGSTRNAFITLTQRAVDTVAQAAKTVNELDQLMESGFRGKEADIVGEMIRELDAIEGDTDQLQIELRNQLFQIETDLPAVEVMFLYQTINSIGVLADRAESVGHHLELLLAR